jgi:hypothetical protein
MRVTFIGGMNEQEYPNLAEAAAGSQNFDLNKSQLQYLPRAPFDHVSTAPTTSPVQGIMQLVKRDDTQTTLVQAGKDVYQWSGVTTWAVTGSVNASSKLRDIYWSLDDYLVICDIEKLTPVMRWDGTAFGLLGTGLGSSLYAKYGAVHNNRVWLANVTIGSTAYPHVILASAFENPQLYDSSKRAGDSTFSTGLEAFYLVSPDLRPINGLHSFYGTLVFSTMNGALSRLTGVDSQDYAIESLYPKSNAAGTEGMINAGNDLLYMRTGGAIESLRATEQYGDVSVDDLSRFIPTSTAGLTDAISVYDQVRQKVMWFTSSKVLVLFKDFLASQLSPWSLYKTVHADAFNTSAAKYMRRADKTYTVYLGGSNGEVFDLNGSGESGDAGAHQVLSARTLRPITEQELRLRQMILRGRVQYRRRTPCTLTISATWGDELSMSSADIPLRGAAAGQAQTVYGGAVYYGGDFYYNAGTEGLNLIATKGFSLVGKGSSVVLSYSVQTSEPFQIDHVDIEESQGAVAQKAAPATAAV